MQVLESQKGSEREGLSLGRVVNEWVLNLEFLCIWRLLSVCWKEKKVKDLMYCLYILNLKYCDNVHATL